MSLPPTYDCPAAIKRITKGLASLGCNPEKAEAAAIMALDEAPFDAPSEHGWNIACQRARFLAGLDHIETDKYVVTPDGIRPE